MPGLFFVFIVVGGYGAFCYGDERIRALVEYGLGASVVFLGLRWLYLVIEEWWDVRRHRERLEHLQAFKHRLPKGEITSAGFFSGGKASVVGELDGRGVELTIRFGRRPMMLFELHLRGGGTDFDAFPSRGLAWLSGTRATIHHGLASLPLELERTLQELVAEGYVQVTHSAGLLRAQRPFHDDELVLATLIERCRALGRLAKLIEPAQRSSTAKLQPEQRCPYCRNAILPGERLDTCVDCGTTHHRDCMNEARGCTVHGCKGARPRRVTRVLK